MTEEEAFDWFRTEGWDAPSYATCVPNPGTTVPKTGSPGKFINRCDRCLEFRPSSRLEGKGWSFYHVWLCAECAGPNPPVIVPQKDTNTFSAFMKSERARLKEIEKERKKLERAEAKARRDSVSSMRGGGAKTRKPKDVEREVP